MTVAQLAKTIVVGLTAGFLSGLFGVGGGILIVPALVLVLAMGQRLAHGTSLAAVLPIAVSGLAGFASEDSVDWPVGLALTAGAMGGAVIGTHALQRLSARALSRAFSAVLIVSAARLVFERGEAGGRADLTVAGFVALVAIGLLAGMLAGLLGVGGGVVMVPAMILLFGVPAAVAKGTSLAVIIPTSVVATYRNVRNDNADLRTAAAVGIAGVASAFVASKISVGLDESVSNAMFAALLAFVAVRMFVKSFAEAG
ncbi:MAG TPA: sulfite exporter TauE/SafE family protein [Acidimicrobiales bacterium]